MNERGLVEVPENAVRDETLAFGLTAPQLGICGLAVGFGALLNLAPLWLPIKLVLLLAIVAPILLAAILPIRGEPAYRWIVRAIRYRRGRRSWQASLEQLPDKPQLSDARDDVLAGGQKTVSRRTAMRWRVWSVRSTPVETAPYAAVGSGSTQASPGFERAVSPGQEGRPMGEQAARLRIVGSDEDRSPEIEPPDDDGEARERPLATPHVGGGLRVVCVLGFAGGTGKTTLTVEIATLVAARARIRPIDGAEQGVRVLILDAARVASAVGLRLGLEPGALSAAWNHRIWREPSAVGELAKQSRWQTDVLTLPPHPQLAERDGQGGDAGSPAFGVLEADALLEGAQRTGYHLVVADLGSVLEDGHRQLIDQADLVLGIIRPTLESLPDIFRLASVLRAQGMGRKLGFIANAADDDTEIRRLAHEVDVPLLGRIPPDPAFTTAADRGEPAWSFSSSLAGPIAEAARAAWPLLPESRAQARPRRSLLRIARDAVPAPGSER
jgi:MinD-like ATPase involved in chromosome partitioning or flagellar assembly